MKGASRIEIGRMLMERGIYTRQGKPWVDSNVKVILTNITYTGNMLFQKEYCEDPITKHRKKNRGELPQYYVENTHEPIIPKDKWDAVQEEFKRRKELGPFGNKSLNTCCFTGKIKCPHCGVSYMHNRRRDRGNELEFWGCGATKKKGGRCPVKGTIPQKVLEAECAAVLDLESFNEDAFLEQIDHIEVPERKVMTFFLKDGREITRIWESTAKKTGGHQNAGNSGVNAINTRIPIRTRTPSTSSQASSNVPVAVPITAASLENAKMALRRGLGIAPDLRINATTPASGTRP